MKKRKELDALIGNRSRRDTGVDGHRGELDSLSSLSSAEAETYFAPSGNFMSAPSKRMTRNSGCGCTVRRMIRICLPACFLSLVAACITACIGIVWMQVQLKSDMERLVNRVGKLETWQQDQPSSLAQMKVSISSIENDMQAMKNGENGVKNLAEKLAILTEKFEGLPKDNVVGELQNNAKDTKKLLDDFKSSMETMTSSISGINSAQQSLTATLEKLNEDVKNLKQQSESQNVQQLSDLVSSSKQNVETNMELLNSTLTRLADRLNQIEAKVPADEAPSLDEIVEQIDPKFDAIKEDIASLKQHDEEENKTISSLKEEFFLMKQKIPKDQPEDHAEGGQGGREGEILPPGDKTRNGEPGEMGKPSSENMETDRSSTFRPNTTPAVPGRQILAVLAKRFQELDKDKNGKLSAQEINDAFGQNAFASLKRYDTIRDDALSVNEILAATNAMNQRDTRN